MGEILKVSCYRNYCIDFNQIWHNNKDHHVVIVGGPSRRPTNPRWRAAAILKKRVKSPYVCDRSTDFDEIWLDDACWTLAADQPLKFRNFENPRWRRSPSWKITKIAISPQRFDRSLRNLVRWRKMGFLTAPTVEKFEFHKSKMVDGHHSENRRITISLQPFDRFWLKLARWCMLVPSAWCKVQIFNFRQSYMAGCRHLANR